MSTFQQNLSAINKLIATIEERHIRIKQYPLDLKHYRENVDLFIIYSSNKKALTLDETHFRTITSDWISGLVISRNTSDREFTGFAEKITPHILISVNIPRLVHQEDRSVAKTISWLIKFFFFVGVLSFALWQLKENHKRIIW